MNPHKHEPFSVLVVDDEPALVRLVVAILESSGISPVMGCTDSHQVMGLLQEINAGVVLMDLVMPELRGEDLLPQVVELYPEVPVIMVTGTHDVDTAVCCMRLGAFDYLTKPVEPARLTAAVRRALELREWRAEYGSLKARLLAQELERPDAFATMLTSNTKMRALFCYAETIAKTNKPVLITGETGVGKELLANAIHKVSARPGQFVAVNAAGVDDAVFSDTLFGHVRGAFTSADSTHAGLIERAAGGTLFLDEIGDLSMASQVKLLRLLQEREYFPVGGDAPRQSDARIVLATNCDLEALINQGRFRPDLYYRLQIHQIHVPPLRERPDDLPLLLGHFIFESANALGKPVPEVSLELNAVLSAYSFPGNVREFEAMVYQAMTRHTGGRLSTDFFLKSMGKDYKSKPENGTGAAPEGGLTFPGNTFPTLKAASDFLVEEALRRSNGNQTAAAAMLGITPSALNKRLHRASD